MQLKAIKAPRGRESVALMNFFFYGAGKGQDLRQGKGRKKGREKAGMNVRKRQEKGSVLMKHPSSSWVKGEGGVYDYRPSILLAVVCPFLRANKFRYSFIHSWGDCC